jgi:hypothetical protein
MFMWAGPFQGSRTLVANFDPRSCLIVAESGGTPNLDPANDVAEGVAFAFRDSIRVASVDRARTAAANAEPLIGGDVIEACSVPSPVGRLETHVTSLVTVALPEDFKLLNRERAEARAQRSGYARYEWRGNDNSTLAIYDDSTRIVRRSAMDSSLNVHSGWTGQLSSECDTDVSGHPVHVDIADASIGVPDRVVHAWFDLRTEEQRQLAQSLVIRSRLDAEEAPRFVHGLKFVAHARSLDRQRALLRAVRSVEISSAWGIQSQD